MPKASKAVAKLWKAEPDEHDFPAARSYLSLVLADDKLDGLIDAFRGADTALYKAKDLLRASGLALLPINNFHVQLDLKKIKRGQPLSPVLLLRGNALAGNRPLEIADGYHRICASYYTNEDTDIPCRIIDPP
jgi:hypothetical protein